MLIVDISSSVEEAQESRASRCDVVGGAESEYPRRADPTAAGEQKRIRRDNVGMKQLPKYRKWLMLLESTASDDSVVNAQVMADK